MKTLMKACLRITFFYLSGVIDQLSVQSSHLCTESMHTVVHPSNVHTRLRYDILFTIRTNTLICSYWCGAIFKKNSVVLKFFQTEYCPKRIRSHITHHNFSSRNVWHLYQITHYHVSTFARSSSKCCST